MFKKTVEDFTCEHCGKKVKGTGYTNHCPECLWSKHVDIHPGDRLQTCGGLMQPIDAYVEKQEVILVHACTICGYTKRNKLSSEDNQEPALKIMSQKGKIL